MQSEGLPRVLLNSCWFIGLVKWQPLWLKIQLHDYWLELAVSTPVLTSLHSPLVYLRINYKTLLIAQKILCGHTVTPSYIFKPKKKSWPLIHPSLQKKKKKKDHRTLALTLLNHLSQWLRFAESLVAAWNPSLQGSLLLPFFVFVGFCLAFSLFVLLVLLFIFFLCVSTVTVCFKKCCMNKTLLTLPTYNYIV